MLQKLYSMMYDISLSRYKNFLLWSPSNLTTMIRNLIHQL